MWGIDPRPMIYIANDTTTSASDRNIYRRHVQCKKHFSGFSYLIFQYNFVEILLIYLRHAFKTLRIDGSTCNPKIYGAPIARWLRRRPTDLAVPRSSPARGKIFSNVNGVLCTQRFIIIRQSPWYNWNTVEKHFKSRHPLIHPKIYTVNVTTIPA